MLPTPDYSHFSIKDYESIYEPSEDTFLFIDALEKDLDCLNALNPLFVFEIGSGSGLVINFLANHLRQNNQTLFFSTDINYKSCIATDLTSIKNKNFINVVNCDLIMPMIERLEKKVDILLFNPPYVVTESHELGARNLQAAWAGGNNGREVMDRLFPFIDHLLSENGVFYLVCIKQNRIDEIEEIFLRMKFMMEIVMNRRAGIETLFILRFNRIKA
jgi:release factor glutamine methyltransferase